MSRQDWFRSTVWNPQVEEQFYAKLSRARRRSRPQYICIQAYHLCQGHPHVALRLLDEYFLLGDHFNDNRAYVFRAEAHLAIGETDKAIEAYELALAREEEYPQSRTDTRLELPFLIASRRINAKYERALELLGTPGTLLFPIQRFKYHASLALIYADSQQDLSTSHAIAALQEARADISGLPYHPELGVVGNRYDTVQAQLSAIAGDSSC